MSLTLPAPVSSGTSNWLPIGSPSTPFTGTFNGGGFTITGLTINAPTLDERGMFAWISSSAELQNIGLVNVSVTGDNYPGGLVGFNDGGAVTNSYATGAVTGSGFAAGGLVGYNDEGFVTSSYATGAVTGSDTTGGLVGFNDAGFVTSSYATGAVTGSDTTGGLVGNNSGGSVMSSYATGVVTGGNTTGGLLGDNDQGSVGDSYATGAVNGSAFVGGLVGFNNAGPITNSYATGAVTGTASVGGLVGFSQNNGTVVNSFWDIETSRQAPSVAPPAGEFGTGLAPAAMKSIATFTGVSPAWLIISGWRAFDVSTRVWGISGAVNNGYPYLLWQLTSDPAGPHVVTFNTQGGSAVAAGVYTTGGTVTLPAAPTRSGFTFNGWFAAASGGTALVSPYSPSGPGAVTLFAQWTAVAAVAIPTAPGELAATGTTLPLMAPMGMAMLLLVAGGFVLLASRKRVGQRV